MTTFGKFCSMFSMILYLRGSCGQKGALEKSRNLNISVKCAINDPDG